MAKYLDWFNKYFSMLVKIGRKMDESPRGVD